MMNTKFIEKDPKKVEKMTKLWAQIFAVCIAQAGLPLLQTIIHMNENFERIYKASYTDTEVYEIIFDNLGVQYTNGGENDET